MTHRIIWPSLIAVILLFELSHSNVAARSNLSWCRVSDPTLDKRSIRFNDIDRLYSTLPGPVHLGLLKVEDVRLARLNDAFGRLVGVWTDRCLDPATDQIVVSTIDHFLCLFLLLWAIIEGLACVDAIVVADRPRLAQVSLRIRFLEGATSVRLSDRCFSTNFLICVRVTATLFFVIDGNILVRSYFFEHVNLLRVCL